jgi:superfamily I DNA/RNA helicase
VVDAWQLESWEAYRDVRRLGRKTRLPEARRRVLWSIFERVQRRLAQEGRLTRASLFGKAASAIEQAKRRPFDHAVIDESQDLSIPHLRFLAALGASRPNGLFFAGDLGQRIFQQPFSWKAAGVEIRGRSRTLTVNYRTSHQIRSQADRLLGAEIRDVDGNVENRRHTVSVFNGPAPRIEIVDSPEAETELALRWIASLSEAGVLPHEVAIFVRSAEQIERARAVALAADLPCVVLDEKVETASGKLSISTMHLAKGLEFRAIVVLACDDEVLPLQARIESITDEADLQDVYDTERHLLYVACTRARDHLLVTGVRPASEFLGDLSAEP